MELISDISMQTEEDSGYKRNSVSSVYSLQSANEYQPDNLFKRNMNCLIKRRAQTWENSLVKVPKLNSLHLSPCVTNSPSSHFTHTISNTTQSEQTCSTGLNTQTSLMDICIENVDEKSPIYFEHHKQMHKLSAQKIAIGI